MAIFELLTDMFRRAVLISLLLTHMVSAHAQNPQNPASAIRGIRGTWVIKSIYRTQNVEGPSPTEQKKLLGTEVTYSNRILKACGQSVSIASVHRHQVDSTEFLANTRVRFIEVHINAASVMEVVLNDRQAGSCFGAFPLPGQDVYLKSDDEIVIDFEGVFYRAVRKK